MPPMNFPNNTEQKTKIKKIIPADNQIDSSPKLQRIHVNKCQGSSNICLDAIIRWKIKVYIKGRFTALLFTRSFRIRGWYFLQSDS